MPGIARLPADVLLRVDVPFDHRPLSVAVARGVVAAEAGPVARRGARGGFGVGCRWRRGCRRRRRRGGRRWRARRRRRDARPHLRRVADRRHHALDHSAAPFEVDREAFAFGDAEARRRRRDERQRRQCPGRRQRQLIAVQRDGDRRAGLLVAIAADVGLQRRAIDGHPGRRCLGRHRRQLLLDQRDDLGIVGLLGAGQRGTDVRSRQLRGCERGRDERHVAALDRLRQDAGRALRSALEQQRHDGRMVVHHRHVDGAHLVEGVLRVDVGAAGDQQLDDLEVPLVGGERQRRRAVARLRVDVGPLVERRRDARGVPGARRGPELLCGGSARAPVERWMPGWRAPRHQRQRQQEDRDRQRHQDSSRRDSTPRRARGGV